MAKFSIPPVEVQCEFGERKGNGQIIQWVDTSQDGLEQRRGCVPASIAPTHPITKAQLLPDGFFTVKGADKLTPADRVWRDYQTYMGR